MNDERVKRAIALAREIVNSYVETERIRQQALRRVSDVEKELFDA